MSRNVEIKAEVADLEEVERRAAAIADEGPTTFDQEDVFFVAPRGRLKLRTLADDRGELIHYERADETGPRESAYNIVATRVPLRLRELLSRALGVEGVVRKTRRVYLSGQTRIHLDRVEGLGGFVELEVVLRSGQSIRDGARIAEELMDEIGIERGRLVGGAYLDLLKGRGAAGRDE